MKTQWCKLVGAGILSVVLSTVSPERMAYGQVDDTATVPVVQDDDDDDDFDWGWIGLLGLLGLAGLMRRDRHDYRDTVATTSTTTPRV